MFRCKPMFCKFFLIDRNMGMIKPLSLNKCVTFYFFNGLSAFFCFM